MYGLHLTDTWAGRVFSQAVTPLGLAIPIYTATAIGGAGICALPLFNPPGSNRNVELITVDIDFGSGTADFGSVGLMAVPLSAVATGQPCTAFADTTPICGFLGGGGSKTRSSNSAGTTTVTAGTAGAPTSTAPGWIRSLASINLEANTGTAHSTGIQTYDFKGTIIVPEGWMVYLAAGKASVALYAGTLVFKEIIKNPAGG